MPDGFYQKLAAYGQVSRMDIGLPREVTAKAALLQGHKQESRPVSPGAEGGRPAMHYRLNEDFVASDVVRWYDKASLGDTVIITLPSRPSVWLSRCPNEHVYWWTEGGRGLTVSLQDARQRLAMFQTRWQDCPDVYGTPQELYGASLLGSGVLCLDRWQR
jgi:hypothetical protein